MAAITTSAGVRTGTRAVIYDVLGKVIIALVIIATVMATEALRPAPAQPAPSRVLVPVPDGQPVPGSAGFTMEVPA